MDQRARHSRCSRNPFRAGHVFGATLVRNCYGLSGCWPPSTDLTGLPANGGFYFQAFSGSVALPAAGYDYNSVWTPLLAGLSPAGMAASLAALVRPCSWCGAHLDSFERPAGDRKIRHRRADRKYRPYLKGQATPVQRPPYHSALIPGTRRGDIGKPSSLASFQLRYSQQAIAFGLVGLGYDE